MSLHNAIHAHVEWLIALTDALDEGRELDPVEVKRDDRCAIGTWIQDAANHFHGEPAFDRLRETHSRFHQCAAKAAEMARKGRREEALRHLDSPRGCGALSENLLVAFGELRQAVNDRDLSPHLLALVLPPDAGLSVPPSEREEKGRR